MADKIPLKTKTVGTGDDGLSQFESGDTIAIAHGGTAATNTGDALTNLGAASTIALNNHTTNVSNPHVVTTAQISAIPQSEKGIANGVASLDGGGKVPIAQIPATAIPSLHIVNDAVERIGLTVQEGDEAKQLDDGSHWIYDGATWHMYPSGSGSSVFGTEFQILEDPNTHTTTSTSLQTAVTMTTTNLPTGLYRIAYHYLWNHNSVSSDFEAEYTVNDIGIMQQHKQEPQDSSGSFGSTGSSQKTPATRISYQTLSGVNTIKLLYRTDDNDDESSVFAITIELWRVS